MSDSNAFMDQEVIEEESLLNVEETDVSVEKCMSINEEKAEYEVQEEAEVQERDEQNFLTNHILKTMILLQRLD